MKINHTKGKWEISTSVEDDGIFGGRPRVQSRLVVDDNIDIPWRIAGLCGGQPREKDDAILLSRVLEVPHECDDPECPGNINWKKLVVYNAMLEILERIEAGMPTDSHPILSLPAVVAYARSLITVEEKGK